MDPDAPWQRSQEAAARKALETEPTPHGRRWSQEFYGGGGKKFSFVLPSP